MNKDVLSILRGCIKLSECFQRPKIVQIFMVYRVWGLNNCKKYVTVRPYTDQCRSSHFAWRSTERPDLYLRLLFKYNCTFMCMFNPVCDALL